MWRGVPVVHAIQVVTLVGNVHKVLQLRLAVVVGQTQEEIRHSNTAARGAPNVRARFPFGRNTGAATRGAASVEVERSGKICEDLLLLGGVHVLEAELQVVVAVDPGEIVFPRVAAPPVLPWPVSVIHVDAERRGGEIDSRNLVEAVRTTEEERGVKPGRCLPEAGVGDG